ncbi:thrombopoietin receptor [Centroberyx affinis]|uniref:thrombopoietin receptor n=1 Tax=Centroberyx affinis TaxID=166261 RepID=UPI003A5BFFC9
MDLHHMWEILLISLWMQVGCVPGMHYEDGAASYLQRKDVLLLKDDKDPKCFTRTEYDFTCFFETPDNRTYDLFYTADEEKRCNVSVQRTEEGTFLHVCSFPSNDVFLHFFTHLKVVEPSTNTTLFTRIVSVEDQLLLDPPADVSLLPTDQAGQLKVAWHIAKKWENSMRYGIRYSSKRLGEKTKEVERNEVHRLVSLVPGEVVQVQVRVKRSISENTGHWSHWSHPVRAMVPQSADDISLMCYTSDLQNITCQWNENTYGEFTYKLFYKIGLSEPSDWKECLADGNWIDFCRFHGDESQVVWVMLSDGSPPAPLNRTFYTEPFTLNSSIKTSLPGHLRRQLERSRLCLTWEAPLLALWAHLQYEVSYQSGGDGAWMTVSLKGPETETCLGLPPGRQYSVRVRAKPNGSVYSGHWSDWSHELTGDIPIDIGAFLILCIPVMLLIMAIVFISLFPRYLSKLKKYLWPPVPNLDKVLQGFLTEFNGKTWDPPFTAKQLAEEAPTSVVEVMCEDEASGLGKPSGECTQLLSPDRGSYGGEQAEGSPGVGLEVSPDYVTLNTDSVVLCPKGNEYVYKQVGECGGLEGRGGDLQTTCHCSCTGRSYGIPSCSSTDLLNHSYFPLAESSDKLDCQVAATRGPGNLYTNLQGPTKANG